MSSKNDVNRAAPENRWRKGLGGTEERERPAGDPLRIGRIARKPRRSAARRLLNNKKNQKLVRTFTLPISETEVFHTGCPT